MKTLVLLLSLSLLLAACAPASPPAAPTEPIAPASPTPTITPTETATATATLAPTETSTQTPTPELVEINTSLSVNLDRLPIQSPDILTSGVLTRSEEASVEKSGFKFSSKAIPFPFSIGTRSPNSTVTFDLAGVLSTDPAFQKYELSPEYVPYRGISANMVEIDGQKVLVMGFLWLNSDGTTSILHLGEQDWNNREKISSWAKVFTGELRLNIIGHIYNASFDRWSPDWGVELPREKALVDEYQNDGGAREDLIKKWAANDNIPEGLDKYVLIGFIGPW